MNRFSQAARNGDLPTLTEALIGTSHLFQADLATVIAVIGFVFVLPFFSLRDFEALNPSSREYGNPWAILRHLVVSAVMTTCISFLLGQYLAAALAIAAMGGLYWFHFWAGASRGIWPSIAFG